MSLSPPCFSANGCPDIGPTLTTSNCLGQVSLSQFPQGLGTSWACWELPARSPHCCRGATSSVPGAREHVIKSCHVK